MFILPLVAKIKSALGASVFVTMCLLPVVTLALLGALRLLSPSARHSYS